MTSILRRKTKLCLETPLLVGKRLLVAHVEPWGLRLRPKGCRHEVNISWAQMWNRANQIAAENRREERLRRAKASGKAMCYCAGGPHPR
jgi:hypothetical protein